MKLNNVVKSWKTWLVVVGASTVLAGSMHAIGSAQRAFLQHGLTERGNWNTDFITTMTKVRMQRIARELELTAAQKTRIRGILKTRQEDLKADFRAVMDARQELNEVAHHATQLMTAASFSSQAATLSEAEAKVAADLSNLHLELASALTAEQREKLDSIHQHVRRHFDIDAMVDAFVEGVE